MNGDRLTVMLDFDGVLLMPAYGNQTEIEAHRAGTSPTIDDALPWIKTAPADTEHVTLTGLADRPVWGVIRPNSIEALRAFAGEENVDLVWATSWLTRPDRLGEAAEQLGLDFIQFPHLDGIEPRNQPLMSLRGHWKTELVMRYVDRGDRVLWVDDQIEARASQEYLAELSIVAPSTYYGLNPRHMALLPQWAAGRDLAVFDNEIRGGWNTTTAM
jgi:hypothetical protein